MTGVYLQQYFTSPYECKEYARKFACLRIFGHILFANLYVCHSNSSQKTSGEVSGETKLFSEGGLGSTPEGQGMNTYRELCAIATDLNQPDLIYKFLHLANHQSMWNSRKVCHYDLRLSILYLAT